eukprot:Gregarina_sp_Poly_1__2951@NODE_1825_length_3265_cov_362_510944_g1184_i0_p4_GENE_NODE_1825_length_3265_cov_362_510944_g1184_i0NODE_1825_length_3265_cov_362_510944_g1184_i0_p4_ORF_typecomplete_len113_score6_70Ferlin_C/PF16165_5/0_016_NODE_1825_length_3265_cov_362_510944_g1184_i022892627
MVRCGQKKSQPRSSPSTGDGLTPQYSFFYFSLQWRLMRHDFSQGFKRILHLVILLKVLIVLLHLLQGTSGTCGVLSSLYNFSFIHCSFSGNPGSDSDFKAMTTNAQNLLSLP